MESVITGTAKAADKWERLLEMATANQKLSGAVRTESQNLRDRLLGMEPPCDEPQPKAPEHDGFVAVLEDVLLATRAHLEKSGSLLEVLRQ